MPRTRRAGLPWRRAVRLALAADTLSIALMELVDNAIMLVIPRSMAAPLDSLLCLRPPLTRDL